MRASGISPGFPGLSQSSGQVAHVLLTRSPLSPGPKPRFSLDLHVLSAPPAFVLSQDQTLREDGFAPKGNPSLRACAQSPTSEEVETGLSSTGSPRRAGPRSRRIA